MNIISKKNCARSPGPATTRQPYFVDNIIQKEPIIISNTQRVTSKDNIKMKSSTKKHKHINGLNENLSSSCGMLTRRSYGSVGFNHENKVQFNNRCSMNDHVIASDAILINDEKRQKHLLELQDNKRANQQKFKKQAVDLREYYNHLRKQEISDAYYCANGQAIKAQQRLTQRQNVIQRVKSLSRSKSKQVGLEFRKKEQQQMRSIQQVEQLKERYSHTVVPELMGTQSSFKNSRNTFNTQLKTQQTFNSPIKVSRFTNEKHLKPSQLSINSPIQTVKSIQSRRIVQNPSIQNSTVMEQSEKPITSRSNSYLQTNNNLNSNTMLNTKNTIKESMSTNASSLMKVLQKSKSNEEFIQKQRVKVIKQAFILNWRQGEDKKRQKSESIYPCKYSQNMKTQRKKIKEEQQKEITKLKYGENALKKNPLQKPQNQSTSNKYMVGYDSLKQYQMKFDQIGKNKIKSCIVAKN